MCIIASVKTKAMEAKMAVKEAHRCQCVICQQTEYHSEQELHCQMNLLMSRLDEQQRRWYAAIEAKKRGHGGTQFIANVTGLSVETIRRGRYELEAGLEDRPTKRVRQAGGGRKTIEKKALSSDSPPRGGG
jgi:hypothetical protein